MLEVRWRVFHALKQAVKAELFMVELSTEQWGMGNGEWAMGNREQGMGNREWAMGHGQWTMNNEPGKRGCCVWSVVGRLGVHEVDTYLQTDTQQLRIS